MHHSHRFWVGFGLICPPENFWLGCVPFWIKKSVVCSCLVWCVLQDMSGCGERTRALSRFISKMGVRIANHDLTTTFFFALECVRLGQSTRQLLIFMFWRMHIEIEVSQPRLGFCLLELWIMLGFHAPCLFGSGNDRIKSPCLVQGGLDPSKTNFD